MARRIPVKAKAAKSEATVDAVEKASPNPMTNLILTDLLLRLPGEVRDLFYEWLDTHYPDRAKRVRSRIHELRGGRDNDPAFGSRMRGEGEFARMLLHRFEMRCRQLGFERDRVGLDCSQLRPPRADGQLDLFR